MSLLCLFDEANTASCSCPFVRRLAPVFDVFNRLWSSASARNESRLHLISPRTRYSCCYSNRNYKRFINSLAFHQFGCQTKRIYKERKWTHLAGGWWKEEEEEERDSEVRQNPEKQIHLTLNWWFYSRLHAEFGLSAWKWNQVHLLSYSAVRKIVLKNLSQVSLKKLFSTHESVK